MDAFGIDQLKADPKNPRYISKEDYAKLKQLLEKFGDLSGIVFNTRTSQLVGGHMRIKAFQEMDGASNVQITQRFDPATRTGTTAIGQVVLNKEIYSYREVDWDEAFQRAANIAANRAGGDFDRDLLAEVTYELSQLENGDELLGLTGMLDDEMKKLIDMVAGEPDIALPDGDKPGFQQITFTLSDEQAEIVNDAVVRAKAQNDFSATGNDNSNGNALYFMARNYLDAVPVQPS